jgi:hypothetical protein
MIKLKTCYIKDSTMYVFEDNFKRIENIAFVTFLDLAQEFDDVEDFNNFYFIIPKSN